MTAFSKLPLGFNWSTPGLREYLLDVLAKRQAILDAQQVELDHLKQKCLNPLVWTIAEWSDAVGISLRTYNCLTGAKRPAIPGVTNGYSTADSSWHPPTEGIETLADLCEWSEGDLLRLKNLGRKSLKEIEAALHEVGLSLRSVVVTPKV